jgi:DNA-binding SARP family transcriptional activator
MLDVRLLGPLEVRDGDRAIPLRSRKQRALLAILALDANKAVSKGRLVDELWGERAPAGAEHALENHVSQLRKLLGASAIETRAPGYVLAVGPEDVDALRFERLVREDGGGRTERLREALALFRGPPLADLADEPFARAEIARLEELQLAAREELIDAELDAGRQAELVPELEALVASHPYRERLRARLMLALYRSGRQADALAAYQRAREALVDDLGLEPGEELQELERSILRQDPALRAPDVPVEPEPAARASRKTVTVLAARLADAERDPEELQALSERLEAAVAEVARRHGGTVETAGRGRALVVFGVPAVREDDALRALRAALELRGRVAVAAGVATGEVLVGDVVTGVPPADAEALAVEAAVGEILLAPETLALAGPAVVHDGRRLVDVEVHGPGRALRLDAPLVGRARPLAALHEALDAATVERTCQFVTVLGVAGVGKSRLVEELVRGLDGATVLLGRCLSYGEAVTFWPLLEAVRGATAIDELAGEGEAAETDSLVLSGEDGVAVGARAAELLRLIDDDAPVEDTARAARLLFEALAARRPVVLVLDDLHWAEPPLLELLERVASELRGAPTLIVCSARPELLEERPGWGAGSPNSRSLLLEPLSDEESAELVDNLLGSAEVPPIVTSYVVETAEGNPFFVEELLGSLVDQDVLRRQHGTWTTVELPSLAVPASIQALLAARLDRLPPAERLVVDLASVEGRRFHRDLVADLLPEELRGSLDALLAALVRRELIRPRSGRGHSFVFRHQLLQDAAYRSIPKQARADLHERFAAWLEERAGGRRAEVEEIVAHHRELAGELRAELGVSRA